MATRQEHLSDDQLKWGYWFLNHRNQIKRILLIFLGVFTGIIWLFSLYKWTMFFIYYEEDTLLMQNFSQAQVDFQTFKEIDAPRPFQILGVTSFKLDDSRYDLMAKLRNPNERWLALLEYQFSVGNSKIKTRTYRDFILPGQDKYLLDLALDAGGSIGTPRINILSLEWKKVPGAQEEIAEKLRINIEGEEFFNSRTLGLTEEVEISKAAFTASNNSSYNFWKVGFPVVVFSGTRPVGVNYLVVDNFGSGETKELDVAWFNPLDSVNRVEVIPDLNIFDFSNYKDFSGELPPDIRDHSKFRRR